MKEITDEKSNIEKWVAVNIPCNGISYSTSRTRTLRQCNVADEHRRQWFVFGAQINAIRPDCRNRCASFSPPEWLPLTASVRSKSSAGMRVYTHIDRSKSRFFSIDRITIEQLQWAHGRFNWFSDSNAIARRSSVGWVKIVLTKWIPAPIAYTSMSCLSPPITIKQRQIDKDVIIIVCKWKSQTRRTFFENQFKLHAISLFGNAIAANSKDNFRIAFRQLHVRHSTHINMARARTQINGDKWPNGAACAQIHVINRSRMKEKKMENCNSNKNKFTIMCINLLSVRLAQQAMHQTDHHRIKL